MPHNNKILFLNGIKLISVNIEGRRHLKERVIPFLQSNNADVICLQEVFEPDFKILRKILNMNGSFSAMTKLTADGEKKLLTKGIAILTSLKTKNIKKSYYHGKPNLIQKKKDDNTNVLHVLLRAEIFKDNEKFIIGTTHFTWTPDGEADNRQRKDLKNLFKILDNIPEIIFCGDFNAPRGREIFNEIVKKYKDNIPQKYETSLDGKLHRMGPKLKVMVDCLFSTPEYKTKNVRLIKGISDHCAIIGDIYKNN